MIDASSSNVHGFPAPQSGEHALDWIGRLREDQLRRWSQGNPLPVAAYVQAFPALSSFPEGLLDLIAHEIQLRREAGEEPTTAEYTESFPELAGELRQQLALDGCLADLEVTDEWAEAEKAALAPLPPEGEEGAGEPPTPAPTGAPSVPARFRILRRLGGGSFGVVWLARDLKNRRPVALKLPRLDSSRPHLLARFHREAEMAARLNHPGLCTLYEAFWEHEPPFLVLEYVDGQTLEQAMAARQPFPLGRAVAILTAAAEGVAHAHHRGIVHRDLKPDNIKIRSDGHVKVLDFGFARPYTSARDLLTSEGRLVGALAFIAPEQLGGSADTVRPAADQYALGLILYQLVTGRHPYLLEEDTSQAQLIQRIEAGRIPPPRQLRADVDEALGSIMLRMTARDPRQRFGTLEEAVGALKAYQQGSRVPVPLPRPRWPRRAAALALVLLLVLGPLVYFVAGGKRPPAPPQPPPTSPQEPAGAALVKHAPEDLPGLLTLLRGDLEVIDGDDQPYQRYFTLAHLHGNPAMGPEDLRRHRDALTELLQSLHLGEPVIPTPVDADGTVLRLDLRRAGWTAAVHWEALQRGNPYALQFPSDNTMRPLRNLAIEIGRKTGVEPDRPRPAFVRADWLLDTFTRPERAEALLALSPAPREEINERLRRIAELRGRMAEVLDLYGRPLDLATACRELGCRDSEVVRQAVLASACLADELGLRPLTEGKPIPRAVWAHSDVVHTTFGELAMQLKLGRRLLVP